MRRTMRHFSGWFTVGCLLLMTRADAGEISFNRQVRPILSDKCFACHGPDANARQADLRLYERESALTVIEPGRPDESELIARVSETDPDIRMPPPETHKRVTKREQAILRRWVEEGAEYEPHWSLMPVADVAPPPVKSEWVTNGIDAFVLRRLKQEKLEASPLADRHTLIRRVTLDLTGLPPTPAEIAAFVNDPNPLDEAYEKVIDRLLVSPRYGEHIVYHWLDAARYADSDGYESDPMRNMWPWRDWAIEAFNHNMPYDQFIIEQLAGDLLENPTLRQQIATGFHRNHRLNNEGGILPEEWLVEYVCDRAETTATVFMGLTWGCARCHDHKFDPITQRDFYRLFAFFNNVPEIGNGRGATNAVPMLNVPRLADIEKYVALLERMKPLEQGLAAIAKGEEFESRFEQWRNGLDEEAHKKLPKALAQTPVADWKATHVKQARQQFLTRVDPAGVAVQEKLGPLQKQKAALLKTGAKVMVMGEMPEPRPTHILNRGAYDQPGEPVSMGTPDWLPPMDESLPRNRLGLAQWLVDPDHPLTARVAVNRFWRLYFGVGLVKTQEDFGSQGESPSHPDLLDWLAHWFIDSGWDVKGLQKLIVMSSTYRQSSQVSPELLARDPENRLLARGPRYRLPAAIVRDQALASGGLLVERFGGPPVKPYQPVGLWQDIIKGRPKYVPDTGEKLYRRSVYTLWRRAVKPPLMMLLDSNERDTCQVGQKRTNTPLQALLLLNDVTFVEAARGLAVRMIREGGENDADRIAYGMQMVISRPTTNDELTILQEELEAARLEYGRNEQSAAALVATGASDPPGDIPTGELATWTVVARILLNLDEAVTKQ